MDWNSFVQVAEKVAREEGYPVAVLLGQAALETGRNVGSAPGYNFFGMKGSGTAGTQTLKTWEDYGNGPVTIMDNFRAYRSPEDSIRDYINLIKNNYPDAWAKRNDPTAMIQAIKAGGYATDPAYVAKVTSTPEFKQYQNVTPQPTETPQAQQSPLQPRKPKSFLDILSDYLFPKAEAAEYNPLNATKNFSQGYQAQPNGVINYTVKPGDTMWGIAEQYLGGGQNWNQLKGYTGSPNQLPVGTQLQVPGRQPQGTVSYTRPIVPQRGAPPPNTSPANANYSSPSGPAYSPTPQQSYSVRPSQPSSGGSAQLNFKPGNTVKPSNVMDKATTTKSGLKLTI